MSSTLLYSYKALTFLMLLLLASGLPYRRNNSTRSLADGEERQTTTYECKQLDSNICARHFNTRSWYGQFPNERGLNANQSTSEFGDFSVLLSLNNYCSHMLYALLCFHYFPQCSPQQPSVVVKPCFEVCTEAMDACLPIARALSGKDILSIPSHLECANFKRMERDVSTSAETNGSSVPLACPKPTVHVDFTLPAGRKTYQVGENKRRLEVCLTLANVGSYSTDHSLAESVTVKLATSSRLAAKRATTHAAATANADYTPLSTTLLFPAGSHKWDKNCVNISITDNDLEESVKSFFIDAVIMSPSNGTFGGAAKSNKGSIEVVIIDDEGRGNNDVLVDFQKPFGQTAKEITEDQGYVEVCLNLTKTANGKLTDPISVYLTLHTTNTVFIPAQLGLDYKPLSTIVQFPVGTIAGTTMCVNVTVVADGLIEADESFNVHASILDQNAARFGNGSQTFGNMEVIIRDDDECMIMGNECRRNCDMRDKATRGIFKHNCYTYAAHVEIHSRKDLEGCSVLNVLVISCWELQSGACVANSTRLSVPVCPNCVTNFTPGTQYLIAGMHDSNGMFLPNYKKGGLFGVWESTKYSSLSEWVESGISYQQNNEVTCSD